MDRRKCFISAAYGANLAVLQRVLDQNRIDWQWAESVPSRKPLFDSVKEAIKKSDFVVCVLADSAPNPNIMLELGIAIGHDLPLLLLSTVKSAIPFSLSTFSHFETDLQDEKVLSFQLDLFLRSLTAKDNSKRTTASKSSSANVSAKSDQSPVRFHSALEQTVVSVIQRAGGRVTIPSLSDKSATPDLLMWLPQQDKELFNPAAVEVKTSIRAQDIRTIQLRLAEFVRASNMGCGLIVVNSFNVEKSLQRLLPIPYTFVIGLSEFESKLLQAELAPWLKRERNRIVHGVR